MKIIFFFVLILMPVLSQSGEKSRSSGEKKPMAEFLSGTKNESKKLVYDTSLFSDPYKNEKTASARKLFKEISPQGKNFVYSPLSLELVLHLLALTSSGESLHKISTFLQLKNEDALQSLEAIRDSFELIAQKPEYYQEPSPPRIDFASAILSTDKYELKQEKIDEIKKTVDLFLKLYDFTSERERLRAKNDANDWVEKKTQGKVKNLIDGMNPDQLMILINALYFKVSWQEAFQESATVKADFHAAKDRTVSADFMRRQFGIQYAETENFQAVKIPMARDDLSFWAIKPKTDFSSVIGDLEKKTLKNLLQQSQNQRVDLYFPKFKIENKLKLLHGLKKVGLDSLTVAPNFELSELFKTKADIVVSEVLQGNFFSLDENGIEAASATAIMMRAGGMPDPKKPLLLKFDRPFLFFIYQKMTGRILFIGQVFEPRI